MILFSLRPLQDAECLLLELLIFFLGLFHLFWFPLLSTVVSPNKYPPCCQEHSGSEANPGPAGKLFRRVMAQAERQDQRLDGKWYNKDNHETGQEAADARRS